MSASRHSRIRYWDPWRWDIPMALLAGMLAILLLHANEPLFLALNRLNRWGGDLFWAYTTLLGDTIVALTLVLPLARRWPELVWAGLLAGLLAALAVHGVKHPLHLERPALALSHAQFHIIGKTYYALSFPSGHTATAFTLAGAIILHLSAAWRRRLAGPLLALASLIGLSRIVVGAHWPLDVLGGAAIGWLAAVFGAFWAQRWPWGATPTGRRWMTVLLIGCALSALLHYKTGYPQTDIWRRSLALCSLGLAGYQLCVERWLPSAAKAQSRQS